MKRSAGVTLIAILALLGSVLVAGAGLLVMAWALVMPQVPARAGAVAHPAPPIYFLVFAGLMYVLPGAWGLISGIGLLRGRNWARISTIVFAVFAALGGVVMLALAALFSTALPPPDGSLSAEDVTRAFAIARAIGIGAGLALIALGVWWTIHLTRPTVVEQFTSGQPIDPAARPLSITVLAWLMLVSSPFSLVSLLMGTPVPFLWTTLAGAGAVTFVLLTAAVLIYSGLGLLKLRPRARQVAIGYYLFGMANLGIFFLGPGREARMNVLLRQQPAWARSATGDELRPAPFPPEVAMMFGAAVGFVATAVPLYFLVTRRRAFFPPSTPVHRSNLPLTE